MSQTSQISKTPGIFTMTNSKQDERQGLPSASNWARYEQCSASWQLEAEARRLSQAAWQTPSAASERGERIHATLNDQALELEADERASADLLEARIAEQVRRIFGTEPVTVLKEERLWLSVGPERVASGRFDRVIYSGTRALVIEVKTGWREPDPAQINPQLKMLSVLVALRFPSVTEIVAQIVSGPFGTTETRFDLKALSEAYNAILGTLEAIKDPHASFSPKAATCRFCPALAICQSAKDLIGPVAKLQYSALPQGERAAKLLDEVELLERHLEAIRAYYSERFLSEPTYSIPGWGMEQGPARRAVTDWHLARKRLEEFIDARDLDETESYKLSSVEKALGKKLSLRGAQLKTKLGEILNGLLEEKFPAPSLKRLKGQPKLEALPL